MRRVLVQRLAKRIESLSADEEAPRYEASHDLSLVRYRDLTFPTATLFTIRFSPAPPAPSALLAQRIVQSILVGRVRDDRCER